jgi:hypothetical protein
VASRILSNGIVDFPVSSASVRSLQGHSGHYSISRRVSALALRMPIASLI